MQRLYKHVISYLFLRIYSYALTNAFNSRYDQLFIRQLKYKLKIINQLQSLLNLMITINCINQILTSVRCVKNEARNLKLFINNYIIFTLYSTQLIILEE